MRTAKLSEVKNMAISLGGSVDESSKRHGFINLDQPPGRIWNANGCHSLLVDWGGPDFDRWSSRERRESLTNSCLDALERMNYGTGPCDGIDCDVCETN